MDTPVRRNLGVIEKLFHVLHGCGALIDVNLARVRGPLTPEILQAALTCLQQRHMILQTRIDEGRAPAFVRMSPPRIALQVLERLSPESALEVAHGELHRPFDSSGPLWRVTLLRGGDRHEIVASFHHAIIDGLSCMHLLDELLALCAELLEGKTPDATLREGIVRPLEELAASRLTLSRKLGFLWNSLKQRCLPAKLIVDGDTSSERGTRFLLRKLGSEVLRPLAARCRSEQTTVHGTLCAAALFGAYARIGGGGAKRLSCHSSVNLRSACGEAVEKATGCLISDVGMRFLISPDSHFWSVAREAKARLDASISAREPHDSILLAQWLRADETMIRKMAALNGGRMNTAHVSNRGRYPIPESYGPLRLEELYATTGIHLVGTCLWLGAISFHDELFLTIAYAEPAVLNSTAEAFADDVTTMLTRAGNDKDAIKVSSA
ncbi:MAG TPA: condensation domain-containing protein [Planctomycetota bacterium]|nr:condensation domain-containing protein [Planctomycetota bacterium]